MDRVKITANTFFNIYNGYDHVVLKQHYVTLTATCGFEKQNLTMHVNTSHKTAILVKTGSYFTEKMSSGFPSDVQRLLCLNSVIHGGS